MIDFIIMVWGNVEKMGFLLAVAMLLAFWIYLKTHGNGA